MTDLSALIARLEAAEVGSRELDLRVFEKFDLVDGERWSDADLEYALTDPDRTINPPRLTQSLDAALALAERVLPGWYFGIQQNRYVSPDLPNNWSAYLSAPRRDEDDIESEAPTPALAMVIATLRAKLDGLDNLDKAVVGQALNNPPQLEIRS